MTPTREWLRRNEIEELVDIRVERLFVDHEKKVDLRLTSLDRELAEVKATQQAFHVENRRRLDLVEKDTKNILQQQTSEQFQREQAQKRVEDRDKTWDRWKTRITVAAGIMTLFGTLGLGNYLHRLFLTGHLFAPVH